MLSLQQIEQQRRMKEEEDRKRAEAAQAAKAQIAISNAPTPDPSRGPQAAPAGSLHQGGQSGGGFMDKMGGVLAQGLGKMIFGFNTGGLVNEPTRTPTPNEPRPAHMQKPSEEGDMPLPRRAWYNAEKRKQEEHEMKLRHKEEAHQTALMMKRKPKGDI